MITDFSGEMTPENRAQVDANGTSTVPPTAFTSRRNKTFNKQQYSVENCMYPIDLMGANNQYGSNYVVFYINVQPGSKLRSSGVGDSGETIPYGVDHNSSGKRSDVATKEFKDVAKNEVAAGAVVGAVTGMVGGFYGSNVGNSPYKVAAGAAEGSWKGAKTGAVSAAIDEFVLSQSATTSQPTKRLKAAIALYMPNDLIVSYKTSWDDADTAASQMAMLGLGTDISEGELVTSSISDTLKKIGGQAGGILTNLALTHAPNKAILSAATRQTANSKKEMLFRGVDFRSFQFSYKFAPRSVEELTVVENIIQLFKFHMHPEYVPGTGNYVFTYPSEFDIVYYNKDSENPHMHRHTACVLTDVTVNKAPNGNFTSFANGAPTEIQVNLSFKELAFLTKEDIREGY